MNYRIFTDSSANLPNEIIETNDIGIVSLSFINNDTVIPSYEKGSDKNLKQFYEMLRKKDNLTTSCANTETFIIEFEKTLKEEKDILYIGFSSGLSNTYECGKKAAEILAKKYPERKILCADSLLASLGEGLLVYSACMKKNEGMTLEEVYDFAVNTKMNVNSLFTVKSLLYLARGGRISKLSYVVGSVVDIKPIMYVNEKGKLVSSEKVIGRKRSISVLADKVSKMIINPEEQTIFISHGDCLDDAKQLANLISSKINVKGFVYNYVDPVVGVHSGPDTLAVFFYGISRIKNDFETEKSNSLANQSL